MPTLNSGPGKRPLLVVALLALVMMLATACQTIPNGPDIIDVTATPAVTPTSSIPSPSPTPVTTPRQSSIAQVVPPRAQSSMAYDEKSAATILFGGDDLMDTWSWDGQNWNQLYPASVPPARSEASMAYDVTNGQIVLFGGIGTTGYPLNDTWIWNGNNWIPIYPATSPSPRAQASMVYDTALQRIVLFGGMVAGGGGLTSTVGDTWTWDGTNWTQLQPTLSPPARAQSSMTYDAIHRQVVLFGGFSGNGVMNDTWTWDGTKWVQQHPRAVPPARAGASLLYDDALRQSVLFAGVAEPKVGDLHDTWLWDGTNWTQKAVQNTPSGFYTVAAYSTTQQKIVAYVVHLVDKTVSNSETWLWDGHAWTVY